MFASYEEEDVDIDVVGAGEDMDTLATLLAFTIACVVCAVGLLTIGIGIGLLY